MEKGGMDAGRQKGRMKKEKDEVEDAEREKGGMV